MSLLFSSPASYRASEKQEASYKILARMAVKRPDKSVKSTRKKLLNCRYFFILKNEMLSSQKSIWRDCVS